MSRWPSSERLDALARCIPIKVAQPLLRAPSIHPCRGGVRPPTTIPSCFHAQVVALHWTGTPPGLSSPGRTGTCTPQEAANDGIRT